MFEIISFVKVLKKQLQRIWRYHVSNRGTIFCPFVTQTSGGSLLDSTYTSFTASTREVSGISVLLKRSFSLCRVNLDSVIIKRGLNLTTFV